MKTDIPKLRRNIVNTLLLSARKIAEGSHIVNRRGIDSLNCRLTQYSIAISQVKGSRSIKAIRGALVRFGYDDNYADVFIEEMK